MMLLNGSYATLTVLNITDWMGDDGKELIETISQLELKEKTQAYEIQMQEYLLEKLGKSS
ncbi:MAG: hypothetical protein WD577_00970 [Bacteroidales bacterium]